MALTKNLFFFFSWCTKTVTDGLPFSRRDFSRFFFSVLGKWVGVLMREHYEAGAGLKENKRVNAAS